MFLIIGIRMVRTLVKGGLRVRKPCSRCGLLSDLREYRWRRWLTLFFVPVIPLSKGESVLTCERCEASFYRGGGAYAPDPGGSTGPAATGGDKTVIECAYCNGKMRIPVFLSKEIHVTCPHCGEKFDVQLDRST